GTATSKDCKTSPPRRVYRAQESESESGYGWTGRRQVEVEEAGRDCCCRV
ncbi:MAG: hypothetical protein AVDCRST_MAG42-450, partial [uncultured Chthoniobacterales bacterium]